MPGRIQSIERAAAILGLLGASPQPLSLADLSDELGVARPTLHGILSTLVDTGLVHQDATTRRYRIGAGLHSLQSGVDRHDLRSRAMSWCDSLASRVGTEVLVCVPAADAAEVVHHVFRPDRRPQARRLGELLPLHATGVGKVLLATSPASRRQPLDLLGYTVRTATTRPRLHQETERARAAGWGTGFAEHRPDLGDIAAPVCGAGGLTVGAVACAGPLDDLFHTDGQPRRAVLEGVLHTATAITNSLAAPR